MPNDLTSSDVHLEYLYCDHWNLVQEAGWLVQLANARGGARGAAGNHAVHRIIFRPFT